MVSWRSGHRSEKGGKEKGTEKDKSRAEVVKTGSTVYEEALAFGCREFLDLSIYFCSLCHWDSLLIKTEELVKPFSLFGEDPWWS